MGSQTLLTSFLASVIKNSPDNLKLMSYGHDVTTKSTKVSCCAKFVRKKWLKPASANAGYMHTL